MSKLDYLDLDTRQLQLLVAVHEEGSVTKAAARLGVTQSAVSHQLDRLRLILKDPLFVKSGRGIAPTSRANDLARRAVGLLEDIKAFAAPDALDLARLNETLVIAANDLQAGLLLPGLLHRLRRAAPGLSLRIIAADIPDANMLRDGRCRMIVSPRPPDATDIKQRMLFDGDYAVFYDASVRQAPERAQDYLDADHVTVLYEPSRRLEVDRFLGDQGIVRNFAVRTPNFSGIPDFLRDSDMLATLPRVLKRTVMREFAVADAPFPGPPFSMYAIWHLRDDADPLMDWVKSELVHVASEMSRKV